MYSLTQQLVMIKNYLKTAYRNLLKNKFYSLINVLGLAIGLAACFFVFKYVHFETSYDRFHKNLSRIYRIPLTYTKSSSNIPTTASNHPAVAPAMKADFPEVEDAARIVHSSIFMKAAMISYQNTKGVTKTFNEDKIYVADPSFLTMFSFPIVAGVKDNILAEPNSAAISQSIAKKYFGNDNPIGQTLFLNKRLPLKISGVFANVPENSHIKFDILISFLSLGQNWGYDNWGWPEFYNYVMLAPGTNPKTIEKRFPSFVNKYMQEKMKILNSGFEFHLQPLEEIHLKSNYRIEVEVNGSEKEIFFLSIIGLFILIIAWINYVNLSTAKSMERAKEVGLRKAIGAVRWQLIGQFLLESVIINFIALFLAILIIIAFSPFFNSFIGKDLSAGLLVRNIWNESWFWLASTGILVLAILIVGIYPALIFSAYRPALVLKGKLTKPFSGISLRKVLVSFQFILSLLLIAGTITVYKQLSYMRKEELGYNKDQILVLKAPAIFDSTLTTRVNYFKTEILKHPAIKSITGTSDIPGKAILGRNTVRKEGEDNTKNFITFLNEVDENFTNTFQVQLVAGRNFLPDDSTDIYKSTRIRVIINEKLVAALGFKTNEDAINQRIIFAAGSGEHNGEIIGVVKNYHQRSLKEKYDPILYYYPNFSLWKYFSLRLETKDVQQNITDIEKLYKATFGDNAFEYFFLNEYFNQQYLSDQRLGKVFGLFTSLAIVVACLGLLGLSSFVIRLRTKEMGVRKVLGASVFDIVSLFSRDFVKMVVLAYIISLPIILITTRKWLDNYAFHIDISWFILVIPLLILLLITLITIGLQSMKTALANPVKALRSE
jgi:putative ABC transport system permease protein